MRFRFRLRLRTFLVVTVLLSFPLAYTGRLWLSAYQKRLATFRERHAAMALHCWYEALELRSEAGNIRQRGDSIDVQKIEELEKRADEYFRKSHWHESLSGRPLPIAGA
jgi:hypothetical protein